MGAGTVSRVVVDVSKLQALRAELADPDAAVEYLAQSLVADIGEHWNDSPGGKAYPIGGSLHKASAPGETPAILTSTLANSIHARRLQRGVWAVRDGTEYGLILEIGMAGWLEARPWLVPAVERIREQFPGVFRDIILEAAK